VTLPDFELFNACGRIILTAEAYAIHEKDLLSRPLDYARYTYQRMMLGATISAADLTQALRLRRALVAGRERFGFRLVHFSVQRDHLHLLAEAAHRRALSRGVQGLSIRIARAINRRLQRRGKVFADRYHARALKTPRAVRWALRYVLLNVRNELTVAP